MSDELTEIKIALARIAERQIADREATEHHRNNLQMKFDTLATRQQVQALELRMDQRVEAAEERLDGLEKNQSKAAWTIALAWIAGLGVVVKTWKGI
jgi:hypothetical protein